jgi:hypothetical protein
LVSQWPEAGALEAGSEADIRLLFFGPCGGPVQ